VSYAFHSIKVKKSSFTQGARISKGFLDGYTPRKMQSMPFDSYDSAIEFLSDELENDQCRFVEFKSKGVDMIAIGAWVHDSEDDEDLHDEY